MIDFAVIDLLAPVRLERVIAVKGKSLLGSVRGEEAFQRNAGYDVVSGIGAPRAFCFDFLKD